MVRLYALVEAGDTEAIDVYLCEQDAKRALEDFCAVSQHGKASSMSLRLSSNAPRRPRRLGRSGRGRGHRLH